MEKWPSFFSSFAPDSNYRNGCISLMVPALILKAILPWRTQQRSCGSSSVESACAEWPTSFTPVSTKCLPLPQTRILHCPAVGVPCILNVPTFPRGFLSFFLFFFFELQFLHILNSFELLLLLSGFTSLGLLKLLIFKSFCVSNCVLSDTKQLGKGTSHRQKIILSFFSQKILEEESIRY